MNRFKIKLGKTTFNVVLIQHSYVRGGLAVEIMDADDHEPFAVLSLWLPETPLLPPGVFYAKTYSENEGLAEQLEAQGAIQRAPEIPPGQSGVIHAPAYRLLKPSNEKDEE